MEIETRKSEGRKRQTGNQNLGQSSVVEKFLPLTEKGKHEILLVRKDT
jgi:hypothetical protein